MRTSWARDGAESDSSASTEPTTAPAATAPPPKIARRSTSVLVLLAAVVGCRRASFDPTGQDMYFQFVAKIKHRHDGFRLPHTGNHGVRGPMLAHPFARRATIAIAAILIASLAATPSGYADAHGQT